MRKYAIPVLILFFTLILWGFFNWDTIFSESQHAYYAVKYGLPGTQAYDSVVEEGSITSPSLNSAVKRLLVYLPSEYYKQTSARFPVVYLLHGYPGTDRDWLTNTNLRKRLDEKIKKGIIPPVIVVFPDMNGPSVRDSQYINAVKIDQKMESYFTDELIPYIDSRYRTIPEREKRAVGGLSSGGYGALYLGLRHSDLFSYVFSHSGYMINREASMDLLVGKNPAVRQHYSIFTIVQKKKPETPFFIYFDIGKNDDRSFLSDNREFDKLLTRLNIPHIYRESEGGHGWGVWSKNIDYSLGYLKAVFSNRLK